MMTNSCYFFRALLLLLSIAITTFSLTGFACEKITSERLMDVNGDEQQQELIDSLAIKQGFGNFTQKKHFKFLSQPISSLGIFVVNQESALWQTESPVFSQLLVTPTTIFQRLTLTEAYQPLIENAELSAVLTTIFKGQINSEDWLLLASENKNVTHELNIEKNAPLKQPTKCLSLEPKSQQLSRIFKLVNLCLLDNQTRKIDLLDNQGNKTEIIMSLIGNELSLVHQNSLKSE